ncbi:MAG TPA: transcriptional repressor [Phycisphaerales bacterium]|nr:transcriptional repressor [Phycisphaerales bacterium]
MTIPSNRSLRLVVSLWDNLGEGFRSGSLNLFLVRKTKQRDAIQQVFEEAERPLSPDEVRAEADKLFPGIGIATIYRNLKSLVETGHLKVVEIPGAAALYEVSGLAHHHHFQCDDCEKVYDIPGCPGNLDHMTPPGFQVSSHSITLFGTCPDCKE